MKAVPAGILCLLVLGGAQSIAATGQSEVLDGLRGYEWRLDERRWRALEQDPVPGLVSVVQDPSTPPYLRARAIAVLTLFPTPQVWNLYVELLRETAGIGRRRVLDAICAAFAREPGFELGTLLEAELQSTDPLLRERSGRCLQEVDQAAEEGLQRR